MHFDGDPDNSDEGDCEASNMGGTEDEEEGDDGEDADDCGAASESRRFRAMKGDKRFLLPKSQVLTKPFEIFLSSWKKQFRKDYECAFKASGWETTNTKKTDVVFESIQHLEDALACGYSRAKDNLVAASHHLTPPGFQGFTRRHSGLRRDGGFHADHQDLYDGGKVSTGEESAQAQGQDRGGAPRCESPEAVGEVTDHGSDDVAAQARSSDTLQSDDTTDFTSAFWFVVADASSGACSTTCSQDDKVGRHDTFALG